ncbi:MAG TPA: amino acid adenylation domain-containing protein [Thermoanaerobaculia bacterium]|nr:amino acid adenylation domain-containing protein [Thermoanaerobaculia bacterium]
MARLGEDGQTPIGRPVADSRLLVLGPHGEILPRGVPGELYLGGRGLARGYLGRPDLTAGAFVPDPTGEEAGARLYRTGDLARFRPDGQLKFVGRADRQVKVRGFRIEPGEVEAQIVGHPGVREAAVVPYEAAPGDLRLAAYVAGAGPAAPSVQELRAFLRSRLPEHMVPSFFAFLPALPVTAGGKVDRGALPPPTAEEPAPAASRAVPATPAEELLAGIWGEVLGRTEIGTGDDFFDLGGHSLLVGQVLARVRTAFGVELPVRATFEARALAALARRIEEARLAHAGGPVSEPLVRVPRDQPLPLSFGQERLWFLHRLDPGSPAYNLPLAFRLTGPLDPGLLERSLDEAFRRHEPLRTTFAEGPNGEAYQVVAPFHAPGLPRIDLSCLPNAATEAQRQMAWEGQRPFDLVSGPVARAFLLRLAEQEHLLVFSCHHVAFDGWSVGVLRRELGALYGAFLAGRRPPLSELAVQYADHAVWQRRRLSGETLAAQLAFWRQRLAGAPAALELPADRLRPPAQSFRGGTLPLAIPAELAAGLRALARSESSTLFLTTLSAFFALLGRLTGQTDLVVGSPVANRREAGSEELLGFFVNTLALRADLAGNPSFRALAAQVRESALAAYSHQDLPFERLVEELQPARDPSRSPLFQVMFSLDPLQDGELAPNLGSELLRIDTGTAKFDLSLFLNDQGGSLTALLEYATDLFDAPTVARLGRSFLTLLSGLVAEGTGMPVSRLPLLGTAESWQILGEWHEPLPPDPAACMHDLVGAQASRTPEATALVAGRERLTYRELDHRAGELARRLAALGVGPEVRVGVCLSRSSSLVVALLGILKAGGAYVPLDPNYPQERLGFMLEDADAAVLITETALASRLPASQARVLLLDGQPEAQEEAEPIQALPGNLAYLIYTSGSTGRPKAVAIEHRSAVAFIHWAHEVFTPEELSSVLASTSISFDLSVFELFVPLARGGQVVLAGNVLELPELPAAGEVITVNSVPSAISALLELVQALPERVRTVNLAGEPLKGSLAQALYAIGVERVRNLYGPSEDTTYSTFETVERASQREPTIGRPITGTWARLLDRHLELVPVGVPGEIYLGGAGLARGYLGRPELTAERFVPDPQAHGVRLYRTGDLGRLLPDGRIEYMGRLDNQVKVRGFRIELGEIETALEAHPQVREAVVVARGEPGGDRFLAAYVVAAGQPAPTSGELAEHLRVRLAEFMVPSTFTLLDAMPLTPNGKVDRKALPAPESGLAALPTPLGPAAPIVELLAGIWAEVLGRDELPGPHDNFFELGGHSLLATRVASRVRAALGIEVPLRTLFAAPTIAALAAAIAALGNRPSAPPIEPLAGRENRPLSFAQQRLWLLDRLEPGSPVYNLPFPRRILGSVAPDLLKRALREVERRHEVLRTTFAVDAESGEPRLTVAPPGGFSLPRIDLAALPSRAGEAEARRLADEDAGRPFDLAAGPLFRARLLTLGADEHHLLMTVHHIAGDGWSINLLLGELSVLYQSYGDGRPSPLPEPAIQYPDFAAWQRHWLDGPLLAGQLAYWRRQLAGAPAVLDLPTDRPRPPVATSRGAHFLTSLPTALTAEVRAFSRRQGATLFMVLLSAFAALLERYTGETDILLGSPIAGRGLGEIEGLVGFFVNTLVLRVDLAGAPSFGALIARVRETALAAYAHQDVPFERLVEELQPERSLARSPLFQVSFVLGVEETARELAPGLSLAPLPVENHTSKFDLTLGLDLRGDTLVADFEYRTDLFDRPKVERWAGQFTDLLTSLVAHPDVPVPEIGLLAGIEHLGHREAQIRLPAPPQQPTAEGPLSPLEELVAGLWVEALGRGSIGLHDHFFALGGYSLLAIRVLARLRAVTGVDLPLRTIFANPTVATLAAEIERSLRAQGAPPLPPIESAGTAPEAPAAAAQERLWYFHQLDRSGSVLNVPNPLRLSGPLQPAALARSLSEIACRHAPLRTTFFNGPEGLRQRIAPPADLVLPLADLSALPSARREEEARRVTEAEAREPFDLATGPLWRTRLLRLEKEEHRLLLTFHHIIVDAWSIDILERELSVLYPAFSQELPSPLPEPALQYADFAVWQRRQLTDQLIAPQLDYWRRQLAGIPPVLDLPADRPRPPRPNFRGAARYLPLPQEVAMQTKELGRREGSTLFMTALAAFAALVGRYTGRTDVVLGSPAANRHTPGTEGLFGFFVGVLPFRLDLSGDPTFRELLRRSREAALGAYAHPDVPFERLVDELDLARDKSRTPLVQVMLSVQNGSGEPLRFAGLTAEPIEVHSATSQFDFTLGVVDVPQGLTLEAEYSTELFTGATVERMLAHLSRLLGAVVADPEIRLSALPAEIGPPKLVETRTVDTSNKPPAGDRGGNRGGDREARLAARRAGLSAEERTLLEQRLRTRGAPRGESPPPASASLVALQPAGSRPPFFCVHPAGGDVLAFQALSRHLGPDQPFHGLQSRGLGPGEVPFNSIEEMAARYRAEITAASAGPYYIGGWSLGGAVAFELARQLAAEGREVALLAIVDSTPGPWPRPAEENESEEDGDDTPWLLEIANYLERLWGLDLGLTTENLRGLSSEDQALRLLSGLKDTPFGAKAGPESLRRLLAVFKTNVRAFRRYQPSPYPGKITLFLPAEGDFADDPTHGWGALSPLPVDVEIVPGDHVSALAEPHVRTLAERLRLCIDLSWDRSSTLETSPK